MMSVSMSFDDLQKEHKGELTYICQNPMCSKEFNFRKKSGPSDSHKYCSPDCFIKYRQQGLDIYNQNPNICLQCNEKIYCHNSKNLSETKLKKFCNRSCSAKYNNSKRVVTTETKNKISMSVKNNPSGFVIDSQKRGVRKKTKTLISKKTILNKKASKKVSKKIPSIILYDKQCYNKECLVLFSTQNKKQKYCSKKCYNKNSGGFKKGSSRGKSGYYKNIWCDSTYELAYIIYCLDHNIAIERNLDFWEYNFEDNTQKYYPDFIINKGLDNESLVEIKGLSRDVDLIKIQAVDRPIIYLDKINLKHIFDYVENKTNIKIARLYSLYENYIPLKKKCGMKECLNYFEIKPRTRTLFCSRSCSAKNRHKKFNCN